MAEEAISNNSVNNNSSQNTTPNPYNDPYFVSGSDNTGIPIVKILFNGKNYLRWSRGIRRALGAKNKLGFLDGSLKEPEPENDLYQAWHRCNFLVASWLLNSIEADLSEDYQCLEYASDVWSEISERYGQCNGLLVYQLKKEIALLKQDNQTLVGYYSKLKKLWDELYSVRKIPTCSCGALLKCTCDFLKRLSNFENEEKLLQFLLGLNSAFENTIQNILSMSPLPTLSHAFNLTSQVEVQKEVSSQNEVPQDSMAMAVHRGLQNRTYKSNDKKDWRKDKMDRFCDHCKVKGHTKDSCFKLNGTPDWYIALKNSKTNGQKINPSKSFANACMSQV